MKRVMRRRDSSWILRESSSPARWASISSISAPKVGNFGDLIEREQARAQPVVDVMRVVGDVVGQRRGLRLQRRDSSARSSGCTAS